MTRLKSEALLTPKDVAEHLQVSLRTVRRLIKSNRIRVTRVGRSIRITSAALRTYLTHAASK